LEDVLRLALAERAALRALDYRAALVEVEIKLEFDEMRVLSFIELGAVLDDVPNRAPGEGLVFVAVAALPDELAAVRAASQAPAPAKVARENASRAATTDEPRRRDLGRTRATLAVVAELAGFRFPDFVVAVVATDERVRDFVEHRAPNFALLIELNVRFRQPNLARAGAALARAASRESVNLEAPTLGDETVLAH
jgi:hypothetical protein